MAYVGRGSGQQDTARYFRSSGLPGVEALHATFTTHRYAPHMHQAWTLALLDEGAAMLDLEGTRHRVRAGTVTLIPPNAIHTGEPEESLGYRYRALYLDVTTGSGWLPEHLWCRPRHPLPTVVRHPELAVALSHLHDSLALPGRKVEQGEALTAVTHKLAELVCDRKGHEAHLTPTGVARALEYIRVHWREDFTLADLAQAAHLSQFHLVRVFREFTGAPPAAYRRALRVRAAQRLLRDGWTPAETAAQCGFYDQSHLNKHFKAATGVTPRQYADRAELAP